MNLMRNKLKSVLLKKISLCAQKVFKSENVGHYLSNRRDGHKTCIVFLTIFPRLCSTLQYKLIYTIIYSVGKGRLNLIVVP